MAAFNLTKKTVEIDQQESVHSDKIDTVSISTSSVDVEVLPVDGDDIGIFLKGEMSENLAEKYEFKILQKVNTLEISFKTNNRSIGFQVGASFTNMRLKVTLPEKTYKDIQVSTSSGKIAINRLTSTLLTSTSSSGSQTISGLKIEHRLFVKASSGDLITNGNVAGKAILHTSSGEINLRGLTCEDTKLETSSGDISYHNDFLNGYLDCKASSGDVDIHVDQLPDSVSIVCNASSGDVTVRNEGLQFKEKTDHRAVAIRGTGDNCINVKASSGDITVY